jgi:hypothetical protein
MKSLSPVRKAARNYLKKKWSVVPIPYGEKAPSISAWPKLRIQAPELGDHFDAHSNIGILTGEPSKNLIDVDLDCDEAIRLAPSLLPSTRRILAENLGTDHISGTTVIRQ